MEFAFLFASALLLLGLLLRARVVLFQICFVPAAILGGLVGLLVLQCGVATTNNNVANTATTLVAELRGWPGFLIAVVFAGLFLDKPAKPWARVVGGAARQGNMVWIICLGQLALGLLAVLLVIEPLRLAPYDGSAPIFFGHLIEAGFVGGHGTSSALGGVYEKIGFPEAKDLAFFMATVGLIYSVVSGMFFVNLAVRRAWIRPHNMQVERASGLEARHHPQPLGKSKVDAAVLDPLVLQVLILAAAYAVGIGIQRLVSLAYDDLPLFMFTLLGGWIVRDGLQLLGIGDLVDSQSIRRITAGAMEYLIVAAIASLNLSLVAKTIGPLSILMLVGFLWTAFCLLYISRRLLPPEHWFELGIINYGMSTGVTASGLMLLRVVDKDFESGAAEEYALAAPLSSPFVGGGIVTVVLVPQMLRSLGVAPTAMIALTVTIFLYVIGLVASRKLSERPGD